MDPGSINNILFQGGYTEPSSLISNQLPLGLQKWKILDVNCTDLGQNDEAITGKSIILHKYHEMPGKFCCNNGVCIDSELGNLMFVTFTQFLFLLF